MKILIAPDKFKGVMTAQELSEILRNLVQKHFPQATLRLSPLADGGEGTLSTTIYLLKGKTITTTVTDPLRRQKQCQYGIAQIPEKDTAIIEMAQPSGLFRLAPEERNPMETTTYGTGEILLESLKHEAKQVKLTLGGVATVDGGLGFLQALGAIFRSKTTLPHGISGKHLSQVQGVNLDPALEAISGIPLTGLVDVEVPLLGDHGAARFFGPQKGATPEMVDELEKGLEQFESLLSKTCGRILKNQRGAGAAGGMGMAILALGGKLESGFEFVSQALKLEEQMKGCDLVITGEGYLDNSSREGKAPVAIARMAQKMGIPCIAIVGAVAPDIHWLKDEGISHVYPLFDKPFPSEDPRKLEVPQRLNDLVTNILKQTKIVL
jgi:glycerate 2-kinase